MHPAIHIVVAFVLLAQFANCDNPTVTESILVGDWSIPRRAQLTDDGFAGPDRGFDVMTLKANHTFSQTAHPTNLPVAHDLSGSWQLDGQTLLLKFTWAHPSMQDMVGQELRLVISEIQADRFVSANARNQNQKMIWTRLK
jgi:hypothetical protein